MNWDKFYLKLHVGPREQETVLANQEMKYRMLNAQTVGLCCNLPGGFRKEANATSFP